MCIRVLMDIRRGFSIRNAIFNIFQLSIRPLPVSWVQFGGEYIELRVSGTMPRLANLYIPKLPMEARPAAAFSPNLNQNSFLLTAFIGVGKIFARDWR